jgi:hypothetical protein
VGADLEDRILSVLPFGSASEREHLMANLGRVGGNRTLAVLIPIVDGSTKTSGSERDVALQTLGAHRSAADHVHLYARALKERNLHNQCVALMLLRRWDTTGAAAPAVAAWVKQRLHGRTARKTKDFAELPMAIGYFAGIDDLATLASLFERYDDQVDGVDRLVLEFMWPREQRQRWASGATGDRPNLDGLGDHGHSYQFYLRYDALLAGIENLQLPPEIGAEEEAQWAAERELEWEAELTQLLTKLERRRDKARS